MVRLPERVVVEREPRSVSPEPRVEVRTLRVIQRDGVLHAELIYQIRGTPEQDGVTLPLPALEIG